MRLLGTVTNREHHAHPLILCDALAAYGGWDAHEDEIIEGRAELALGELAACIAPGGDHGHVDVLARDDGGLVLVNDQREPPDAAELAARPFAGVPIGAVDVPSGQLAIGIAYNPFPSPRARDGERLVVPVRAARFDVRADDFQDRGAYVWRVELRPAKPV